MAAADIDQIYEIWKSVQGYEGLYEVSSLARVRRLPTVLKGKNRFQDGYVLRRRGRILKQSIARNSKSAHYPYLTLSKDNIHKTTNVHRLVAIAFLPNQTNKPEVNHKNGIKWDNSLNNLEWVTRSENQIHSRRVLKHKIGRHRRVLRVCPFTDEERMFETVREAMEDAGFNQPRVHKFIDTNVACQGFYWYSIGGSTIRAKPKKTRKGKMTSEGYFACWLRDPAKAQKRKLRDAASAQRRTQAAEERIRQMLGVVV